MKKIIFGILISFFVSPLWSQTVEIMKVVSEADEYEILKDKYSFIYCYTIVFTNNKGNTIELSLEKEYNSFTKKGNVFKYTIWYEERNKKRDLIKDAVNNIESKDIPFNTFRDNNIYLDGIFDEDDESKGPTVFYYKDNEFIVIMGTKLALQINLALSEFFVDSYNLEIVGSFAPDLEIDKSYKKIILKQVLVRN